MRCKSETGAAEAGRDQKVATALIAVAPSHRIAATRYSRSLIVAVSVTGWSTNNGASPRKRKRAIDPGNCRAKVHSARL